MGKYTIVVETDAQKQLQQHFKSGDRAIIKKIDRIFEELEEHPKTGIGQPEELKYTLSGCWSRQISKKDRLVYRIEDDVVTVTIVAAKGHYGDK